VTPGSYTPDSLRLVDASNPQIVFEPKRDYVMDDTWGAFAIAATSRLKVGQKVLARYEMSLRRVDALVIDASGQPKLIIGKPSADCPEPPVIPEGMLHLANLYRPFNATTVEPDHVYPITDAKPDLTPISNESLSPLLAKLREGKDVTVVCWGDSVTACGESSTPAKCYVRLFESMLKERFPKARIKVINAGIGGSSTLNRLKDIQKEVLDFKPDLVTLEFVNDMGLHADMMQRHYSEILSRTKQAGAAWIILTPHFVMPSWMGFKGNRGIDSRPGVAFLRKFTKDNNVPLADASRRWELLEKMGVPYETMLRNGINHPEDRGHRIFAEELMRFFPGD
jgi:lysophospholipase L1-like esterase